MSNPFSYRNRFASYLKRERRAIDAWTSEKTREELYQQLCNEKTGQPYTDAQKKSFEQKQLVMKKFRQQRASGEDDVTFLDGRMAKIIVDDYSQRPIDESWYLRSLDFPKLKKLTPAAVEVLMSYNSPISFPWSALQNTPFLLKKLTKRKNTTTLTEIGKLDLDTAKMFQYAKGEFFLMGIKGLEVEVAAQLIKAKEAFWIDVDKKPSEEIIEILAKKRNLYLLPMEYYTLPIAVREAKKSR